MCGEPGDEDTGQFFRGGCTGRDKGAGTDRAMGAEAEWTWWILGDGQALQGTGVVVVGIIIRELISILY